MPLTPDEWNCLAHALQLTPQQTRIIELLLRGMRDKQIAATLHLRLPTIRTHLRLAFQKLGVNDRVELVLFIFSLTQTKRRRFEKSEVNQK